MYFWREDYFKTLLDVAKEARAVPEWADYAVFCEQYERGLRPKAFAILEAFMASFERAPFAERRRFVAWVSCQADRRDGRQALIPHPLHVRIVEPTLLEWTLVEPDCAEPHVWLGGYEHIKLAFQLDPNNQIARRKLVILTLARVNIESYELGHAGNVDQIKEDLTILSEAEELTKGLLNGEDRLGLSRDIAEDRKLIEQYL
jgi:hypothetical protein